MMAETKEGEVSNTESELTPTMTLILNHVPSDGWVSSYEVAHKTGELRKKTARYLYYIFVAGKVERHKQGKQWMYRRLADAALSQEAPHDPR